VEHQWGKRLIRSWDEAGWIDAPQRIGAKTAPIIGARADEVIVADSTSVNLFNLLVAAAKLSDPSTILTEAGDFPTGLYIAAAAADLWSCASRPLTVPSFSVGSIRTPIWFC
jgi:kynureninase